MEDTVPDLTVLCVSGLHGYGKRRGSLKRNPINGRSEERSYEANKLMRDEINVKKELTVNQRF
jgi:hypothetical protein